MVCTVQSENRQLKAEVRRLNEKVENLLMLVKRQSIEMGHQRDLIAFAQSVIWHCPYCQRQWQAELES